MTVSSGTVYSFGPFQLDTLVPSKAGTRISFLTGFNMRR